MNQNSLQSVPNAIGSYRWQNIRIYNPCTKVKTTRGIFIRQWCSSLALDPKSGIHEPWHYGEDPPIVDEDQARAAGEILYKIRKFTWP